MTVFSVESDRVEGLYGTREEAERAAEEYREAERTEHEIPAVSVWGYELNQGPGRLVTVYPRRNAKLMELTLDELLTRDRELQAGPSKERSALVAEMRKRFDKEGWRRFQDQLIAQRED
ncbi:hypothetical protein AD006_01070 [Pseudonocardia sp. EC080610-09]|uniref:hypothetical protein n=1 Tax=unclassified Pseudonocardia TaxID=2619320 RepID=UPI0006CB48D9|nr:MULTISPECIES: hypothetical protein [unclassified Pseudonocardia]ALE74922.1 hypothetical protein FRP1_21900 [Pseudonocardia sp. EC080625-04]ALL74261.1 hypothetical protein AD006_01070 [Pseudonocardia sp. EC080610-09]ALL81284.1 hypothetical protein AD017_08895 [Pseudonocardia sp. EC080619-01]